jgi:hypothetical protein
MLGKARCAYASAAYEDKTPAAIGLFGAVTSILPYVGATIDCSPGNLRSPAPVATRYVWSYERLVREVPCVPERTTTTPPSSMKEFIVGFHESAIVVMIDPAEFPVPV